MTSSTRSFHDLVQNAHDGRLKLPAFQRKWRWKSDKVIKLFDSLRQGYPIGCLLFLKGENELLAPRNFEGAHESADGAKADYLVLDGQQRITAGIHLFFSTGPKQYFLRLDRLSELIGDVKLNLKNKSATENFVSALDETDGYLVARQSIADPRALLIKKHLLCTSILGDAVELSVALADYVKAYPDKEDLAHRIIVPHFALTKTDTVPVIEIEAATQIEAISRIFTTLNTTGQLLTPFELVVSILYPKQIDLSQEIEEFRAEGTHYPNMDSTGEILLQTIAMLGKKEPKKANLPRTITAELYQHHKCSAFESLEALGKFLTKRLGAGLDIKGADLVPYDAIYAPMALGLMLITEKKLKGKELVKAEKKLERWYVGSALSNRYQEGVHNKQVKDLAEFVSWVEEDDKVPGWLSEVVIPRLIRHSPNGAIGKLIRGLINQKSPQDPATDHQIGYRSGVYQTEKHHIFPIKYLPTLKGWSKHDSGDVIVNLMFLEGETNKRWINGNPHDHLNEAIQMQHETKVKVAYQRQFVEAAAFAILQQPSKSKSDFDNFLALRETTIQTMIETEFDFPRGGATTTEDDEVSED